MFMEKKEPEGEAKSGEGNWSSPGPGKTQREISYRSRVPKGWNRAVGPRVPWGWGFLC